MTPPGAPVSSAWLGRGPFVVLGPAAPLTRIEPVRCSAWMDDAPYEGFREAKNLSVRVLFDFYSVIHLIDAQNLGIAAVTSQFVVLAHDQRLDRLGRADLGAQPAEAAAGQVE